MRKNKVDSWIDISIEDRNYLGRKRTDYSTFHKGTTIPIRYHEYFLNNISEEIIKGKQVKIEIHIKDEIFKGILRWPGSKDRSGISIQLLYSEKALLELLRDKLSVSYIYIMKYLEEHGKKPSSIPEEYQEYIDFYKDDKKDSFILKLISRDEIINGEHNELDEAEDEDELDDLDEVEKHSIVQKEFNLVEAIKYINLYILGKGFSYEDSLIKNFYTSLKTKPFVILSGISGTGKSKIVELFAEAIGATTDNGRFKLIPVKPDWSDATDLLGYRNIEGKFTPGIITKFCYDALKNPELPYFLCLDEMNLARVEYYFSDILSHMETRKLNSDGEIITNRLLSKEQFGRDEASYDKYGDVYIPQNLYIVGTVNMDETTFPFSKKVLDRANTIEFNKVNLGYSFEEIEYVENKIYHNDFLKSEFLKLSQCIEYKNLATDIIDRLIEINTVLEGHGQHFGYRVRDEIVFYMIYATIDGLMTLDEAFDLCIVQKILPKINGSSNEVLDILIELYTLINKVKFDKNIYMEEREIDNLEELGKNSNYKLTNEKLIYMIRRFVRDGFTTFWQ